MKRFRPSPLLVLALCGCETLDRPPRADPVHEALPAPDAAPRLGPDSAVPERPRPAPERVADATIESLETSAPSDEFARLKALAKAAIDAGDWARAREIIDDLLSGPSLARARELLDAGQPDEALAVTAVAVAAAPNDPRVQLTHAEALLGAGISSRALDKLEDALRAFLRAGELPDALLGAARTARELGRHADELDFARRALRALSERGPTSVRYAEEPERTLARAHWNAFEALSASELATPAGLELGDASVQALRGLLAIAPDEPWTWHRLADVLARLGRREELLMELTRAFARLAGESTLADRLERVAREHGGGAEVQRTFESLRGRAPASPLVWWIPARERFDAALERMTERPIDEFRVAERDFAAARELDARLNAAALEREALCRCARGWCELDAGLLKLAVGSFRSMDQLGPGLVLRSLPGRLESGVAGLTAAAEAYRARAELWAAGQVAEDLRKRVPDSIERASFAGTMQREAALQARQFASEYALAAERKIADARRLSELRRRASIDPALPSGSRLDAAFREASSAQLGRVTKGFERSHVAFLAAWRLKPDDVRLAVDASFVAIVHLGVDLDFARDRLRSALSAGAKQLAATGLGAVERARLEQSLGDAHELLGVYYLEHAKDAAKALEAFEKSLAASPVPRPAVEQLHIPRCRALLQR